MRYVLALLALLLPGAAQAQTFPLDYTRYPTPTFRAFATQKGFTSINNIPDVDLTLNQRFGAQLPDGAYNNPNVVAWAPGNRISYCPAMSCLLTPNFDHRRTSLLVSANTNLDAQGQEDSLTIATSINTGFTRDWAASTTYAQNDNILIRTGGSRAYRQTQTSCVSGSTAPVGTGLGIADGTCRWDWINEGAITAHTGFYNETRVQPGAGPSWGQAQNYAIGPGTPLSFHLNSEYDFTNRSGTCAGFSEKNCYNQYIRQNGYRINTIVDIGTGNSPDDDNPTERDFSSRWGLRMSGSLLASDANIQIDAAGAFGLRFGSLAGPAAFTSAAIQDQSSSPIGLDIGGTKTSSAIRVTATTPNGIDLSSGNFTVRQIFGTGFAIGANGELRVLSVQATASSTPASSSAACSTGQQAWDANYYYQCIATNTWKRSPLSSW